MIEDILFMYARKMTPKYLNKLKRLLGGSLSVKNMFSPNIYSKLMPKVHVPGVNLINDLVVASSNLQSDKFEGLADKFNRTPNMSYGFKSKAEENRFNNEAFEALKQLRTLLTAEIIKNLVVLTPVDTGRLLSSLTVDEDEMTTTLSFDTPYMVYVHELDNKHTPPTRNKFLEVAVDNAFAKLKDAAAIFSFNLIIDDKPTLKLIINGADKNNEYSPISQYDEDIDAHFQMMQQRVESRNNDEREMIRMSTWADKARQLKLV